MRIPLGCSSQANIVGLTGSAGKLRCPRCSGCKHLSSNKSFLFAGVFGAIALAIIALSWAMRPQTVDLPTERIAAEPAKTVILPPARPAEKFVAEAPKSVTLPPSRPAEKFVAEAPKSITLPPSRPAEKIVAEATKSLTLPPASTHLSAVLSAPTSKEGWLSVPPNKGVLVLYIPLVASDRVVVGSRWSGRPLDSVRPRLGCLSCGNIGWMLGRIS